MLLFEILLEYSYPHFLQRYRINDVPSTSTLLEQDSQVAGIFRPINLPKKYNPTTNSKNSRTNDLGLKMNTHAKDPNNGIKNSKNIIMFICNFTLIIFPFRH